MKNIEDKLKRISFLSGEDFYFLTYLILLCVRHFSSKNTHIFSDHRKLTYLMQIICSSSVVNVLIENKNKERLNVLDKELLFDSFTKAALHKREVYKILRALEIKGIVKLTASKNVEVFNVNLIESDVVTQLLNSPVFERELINIERVKSNFKRINSLGLDGFITKFYSDYGLRIWAY
ncbi:hypothetical protein [Serratia fonticola]